MSFWKIEEIIFLASNVLRCVILTYIEDFLVPSSQQLLSKDFHNTKKLSELIGKNVVSVADREEKISLGGGGTGTTRFALVATMKDGSVEHLFCKVPSLSVFERIFLTVFKIYDNEILFYEKIRRLLPDMTSKCNEFSWCPQAYRAKMLGCGKFVLILEDVSYRSGGCEFCYVMDEYTNARAESVLKRLSQLHAHFWNNPPAGVWEYSKETGEALSNTPRFLRTIAEYSFKKVLVRYGRKVTFSPIICELINLYLNNHLLIRKFWSSGTLTLCHGDCHIGNMFFSRNNMDNMGFLDMQCVSADHCMRDVAYHLINSCASDVLAENEEKWLNFYLKSLEFSLLSCGFAPQYQILTYEEAFFLYRTHAAYCLIAWIICCGASDLVLETTAVGALQRMVDTCTRLDVLGAIQHVVKHT